MHLPVKSAHFVQCKVTIVQVAHSVPVKYSSEAQGMHVSPLPELRPLHTQVVFMSEYPSKHAEHVVPVFLEFDVQAVQLFPQQ